MACPYTGNGTRRLLTHGAVQAPCERQAVHRVDGVKKFSGAGGLIALQMPDQMPGGVKVSNLRPLGLPFLDAVLAKVTDASGISLADGLRWECLRDSHKRDVFGPPSRPGSCSCDSLADPQEILGDAHEGIVSTDERRWPSTRRRIATEATASRSRGNATGVIQRGCRERADGLDSQANASRGAHGARQGHRH